MQKIRHDGSPGTAWCSGCHEYRPAERFWRRNGRGNGYQSRCRDCQRLSALSLPHGTFRRYSYAGCRCQPCRDANAAQSRAYKLARRRNGGEPLRRP